MSRVLYKADNISVIWEICLWNCTTATQNNTNYWLKLFFTIFINGKLKTFNSDFTFQTIKWEIDNINLCKFWDVLNLLDDLGYPIKEVRDDWLNYTWSIITKWIHSFVIWQDWDKLIFE
jgi:hypothetical protein